MHSTIKKLGAILLALTLLFALSATAFATGLDEDIDQTDGTSTISEQGVLQNPVDDDTNPATPPKYNSVSTTVDFKKDIIVFNSDSTSQTVYHPNVSYTYTMTAVGTTATPINAATTITDEYDVTATVFGGVIAAVSSTTATVDFTDADTVATTKNGAKISDTFSFTFVPANFPHAGVYRYKITETDATTAKNTYTRGNAGVISGASYEDERFLDVYVKNNDAGTGLEIYGYAMYEGSNTSAFDADDAPLAAKTNGYVVNDETDLTDTTNCDYYWTVNLTVEKEVTGQLGDKQNEFPFSIAFGAQPTNFAKADYSTYDTSEGAVDGTHSGTTASRNATVATVLAHDDYITFIGLPMATTATVTETNNTYDVYTASAEHDNTAALTVNSNATASLANNATGAVNALTVYNTSDNTTPVSGGQIDATDVTDTIDTITVTNALSAVSPTGVVLRVAPYALMLGAGFIFLAISKRRKEEAEA